MRRDASGLVMIGAALLVTGAIVFFVAEHEVGLRREQIRAQGIALANALSRIPLERLAPSDGRLSPLPLIRVAQGETSLAYAAVVDRSGRILGAVRADGIEPLATPTPLDPSSWTSERRVEVGHPPRLVREFGAPILEDGGLVAHVRIGFFEPGFEVVLARPSFHAHLALLIFLLTPLALLLVRREIEPLERALRSVDPEVDGSGATIGLGRAPSESVELFVDRFRLLAEDLDRKKEAMQRERMALLASSKVLAHQKNRAEVVLEAIPDAILTIDESGRITLANGRADVLLRHAHDELMGAPPSLWSPCPEVTRLVGRHVGGARRVQRSESVEYSPDALGQRRILVVIQAMPSGSGAILAFRDISGEHAARKTQAEFLAHMAHELKAPLNVMAMYSESLLSPEASEESFRIDACNVIRDEVDRLNALINNIFSIGRIESGAVSLDRQRVRIRELLSDLFESASREGEARQLEFVLELPSAMEPIHADKSLISVAIKNLLTNAIKYNRDGGKVSLIATEDDAGLSIRVVDTGVGIREEDLGLVFEKFYRSEDDSVRKISGHGLGLSLVKEIVALHGGEIRVRSQPEEGSDFCLFFSRSSALFREGD